MAQRVVLVVALGAVFYFVGSYLTGGTRIPTGWTGYAPLQAVPLVSRAGLSGTGSLLLWLVLVLVWTGASLTLLRPRRGRPPAAEVDADNAVRETGTR
jgi:heme/copper-type cytochrome/quinol oxidase subunit 1